MSGQGSPPAARVHGRCSHNSMACTGTEAPTTGKRAAEREAERGRGVPRRRVPPAASEQVGGQLEDRPPKPAPQGALGRANWAPLTVDSTPGPRPATEQSTPRGRRRTAQERRAEVRPSRARLGAELPPVHGGAEQNGPAFIRTVCLSGDSCLLGSARLPRGASADRSWRWPGRCPRRRSCPSPERPGSW